MENEKKVLVTGVTGFLGSHTTIQLLNQGYQVIGTLRNMSRAEEIKKVIAAKTNNIDNLSFAIADLLDENVWEDLCTQVDYVQHIASPFPRELPKDENELIIPAQRGAINILRAAAKHQVKRVVLTSSTGAIMYGKDQKLKSAIFNENDWTDIQNKKDTTPYFRSKTIAEKSAWDFIAQDTSGLELATVYPGAILGPVLEKDFGTSANIIIKTIDGSSPALPNIGFDMVDVRSVADLLIKAMISPKAANQRYIGSSGFLMFKDIAKVIKKAYPDRKIPTSILPNFVVKLYANFESSLKPVLLDLGKERRMDFSKAQNELGWQPISTEEAILSCTKSVIELGIVK